MTLWVEESAEKVFGAINDVRAWWGEGIEGGAEKLSDEFDYWHRDLHYSKQRITEMIPGKKVVWLVTESSLSFTEKKTEWTNTTIGFEISSKGTKTEIRFTHKGLTPGAECYRACSEGWSYYLQHSLLPLILTGKGQPDSKEIAEEGKEYMSVNR